MLLDISFYENVIFVMVILVICLYSVNEMIAIGRLMLLSPCTVLHTSHTHEHSFF